MMLPHCHDMRVEISSCGTYRYDLRRIWARGSLLLWVMLNPSTADGLQSDRTIDKIMRFTFGWGYAGLAVVNLFALRSTDPQALRHHIDPIGPMNDAYIRGWTKITKKIVVAWGNDGEFRSRGNEVGRMLLTRVPFLHCLKVTDKGHPYHPLYVKETTPLQLWRPAA